MAKGLVEPIYVVNPVSDVDALYGTYNSLQAALSIIAPNLRAIGRKFGVVNSNNEIKEYVFNGGILDGHAKLVNSLFTYDSVASALTALGTNDRVMGVPVYIIEDPSTVFKEDFITRVEGDGGTIESPECIDLSEFVLWKDDFGNYIGGTAKTYHFDGGIEDENLVEKKQNKVVQLIENTSGASQVVAVNNNSALIIVKENNTANSVDLEFDEPLSDKITIVNSSQSEVRIFIKSGSPIIIEGSVVSNTPGVIPPGNASISGQNISLNLESNIYKIDENKFIATNLEDA